MILPSALSNPFPVNDCETNTGAPNTWVAIANRNNRTVLFININAPNFLRIQFKNKKNSFFGSICLMLIKFFKLKKLIIKRIGSF